MPTYGDAPTVHTVRHSDWEREMKQSLLASEARKNPTSSRVWSIAWPWRRMRAMFTASRAVTAPTFAPHPVPDLDLDECEDCPETKAS